MIDAFFIELAKNVFLNLTKMTNLILIPKPNPLCPESHFLRPLLDLRGDTLMLEPTLFHPRRLPDG